jgi:hypothetical protein
VHGRTASAAFDANDPEPTKPKWEFPRLCRGGSKSLTYPGVDSRMASTKHTKGNRIDGWLEADAPDRGAVMQDVVLRIRAGNSARIVSTHVEAFLSGGGLPS